MKNYMPSVQKSVYIGNSVRTKKRKKAQAKKLLAENDQQITNFFNPLSLQSHPSSDPDKPDNQSDNQNSDDQNSECEEHFNYEQLIKSLENEVKSGNLDSRYKLRLTALLQYLRLINHEEPKIKASLSIAQQLNKGPYFAHCLREWEKLVKNGETIPISKRGKHCKIKSLLDDEDVQMQIATYLHENKFEFYVADFVDYVKNVVFPSLGIEQETTISTRTARNWLNKMEFEFKQFKKGVYVDGHERPDVIAL
ncbi:hypothetical protein RhiirA4_473455 [Rhizophagus irregularis]|uniref:Uncharacterized protein n=1 Tax=Rhizophagus irregularis TaxID=588596 RepID=A0A2I1H6R8_9GLOM|nr:hypothetical protein RhiirA4_473455 [Rhizophagus irregularis]